MYTPHTVSLINRHGDDFHLTILRGVMVQDMARQSVLIAGDYDASYTRVFIPFSVDARNIKGTEVTYLPPRAYERNETPDLYWTIRADGEEAGRSSFFVKGEIPEACSLAEARDLYDGVFIATSISTRDYGPPWMQHFEVSSRINERSGMNYS